MNALPQDYMRCAPVNLEKVGRGNDGNGGGELDIDGDGGLNFFFLI